MECIPIYGHGYLANTALTYLAEKNIPIADSRGQSNDNASNKAGHYSGLQARITSINQSAFYVPRTVHSLNLVGNNAAVLSRDGFFFLVSFRGCIHIFQHHHIEVRKYSHSKRLIDTGYTRIKEALPSFFEMIL